MADNEFIPRALPVYDVWDVTPVAANTKIYYLTLGSKSVSYTSDGSATVAEITAGLVVAWNAARTAGIAEFLQATIADGTTKVTITATTIGVPLGLTATSTGGSLTAVNTTAATGPAFWNDANNWSQARVPISTDNVYIRGTSQPILYVPTSAQTVLSFHRDASHTGQLGLTEQNPSGYAEYRQQGLILTTAVSDFGFGSGQGAGFGRVQFSGTVGCATTVYSTGSPRDSAIGALCLSFNTSANSSLIALSGDVRVSTRRGLGEGSALSTVQIGGDPSKLTNIVIGSDATIASTLVINSGNVETNTGPAGNATLNGGNLKHLAGTIGGALLINEGAAVNWMASSCPPSSTTIGSNGRLSFEENPYTFNQWSTAIQCFSKAKLHNGTGSLLGMTFKANGCAPESVDVHYPQGATVTAS